VPKVIDKKQVVLVTGAAGYIGSHTALALARAGHDVVGIDDFSNSSRGVPARLAALSPRPIEWIECDVRDPDRLHGVLAASKPDSVIHFAGRKSVEESCREPLGYYDVNVSGTLRLLEAMQAFGIMRLVFSSSATVYDASQPSPVREDGNLHCSSPYGRSKLMAEQIIRDAAASTEGLRYSILRYFNPVGADESGQLGECPLGKPSNLMPAICLAASPHGSALTIYGADYQTRDGSGVRDYVHVDDVAQAHLVALERLGDCPTSFVANIGSGCGFSVFEVIRAFTRATGVQVPFEVADRRAGDVAELYADVSTAIELLGWRASHDIERMCRDAWRWQKLNPGGYGV
jgi:UDP-glucose 4-epimerase